MPKSVEEYLDFLLSEKGEDVVIRGMEARAIITDVNDRLSYYDDKMLRTDVEMFLGDRVNYQSSQWLIVSEIDKNKKSYRARMRKINYMIKMVIDEVLCTFMAIIEGIRFGIDEGKYMNVEAGKIQVTIPVDAITNKIDVGMRFIKMGKAWKIVGIDKSRLGLIILHCEKDLFGVHDDKMNEIANTNLVAVWGIEINEENRQVALNKPYTFTATVEKNGLEYQEAAIVWESSNENVAVVNNGVITGIAVGKVEITAYIKDIPTEKTSIQIEILAFIPDIITYKMWSSYIDGSNKSYSDFSVFYGYEKLFGVEKFINGALASQNDTYTFELNANETPSSKYKYSIIDEDTVKLEAKGYGDILILTAICNESGERLTQRIEFKGLF